MNSPEVLRRAILESHRATSHHLSTVPLRTVLEGGRVWDGHVEIFWLINHAEAKTAYAWTDELSLGKEEERHIVVLHLPPVDSPETAVRQAMKA